MAFEPSPLERLAIAKIERRRSFLAPARAASIQPALDQVARRLARSVRQESVLESAWGRVAGADMASRVRAIGLNAGVLTLCAPDRSAVFVVDRFMKSGGRAALASALGVAITRVVVKAEGSAGPSTGAGPSAKGRSKAALRGDASGPSSGKSARRTTPPPRP